jgi:hypothetical protein
VNFIENFLDKIGFTDKLKQWHAQKKSETESFNFGAIEYNIDQKSDAPPKPYDHVD